MRLKLPSWALENICIGSSGVQCGHCLKCSWLAADGEIPNVTFTLTPSHDKKCPEHKDAGIPITLEMETEDEYHTRALEGAWKRAQR